MKTITTLAVSAILICGVAVASAQNAVSPNKEEPSPAAINGGGTKTGVKAGSTSGEKASSAMKSDVKTGKSASMKKKQRSTTGSAADSENRGSPLYGPSHTKLPSNSSK